MGRVCLGKMTDARQIERSMQHAAEKHTVESLVHASDLAIAENQIG